MQKFRIIVSIIWVIAILCCKNERLPTSPAPLPEQKPPSLLIVFPTEYPYNVVGKDVVLTVDIGTVGADWVQAIIDGRVVGDGQRVEVDRGIFLVDVWDFGVQGHKQIVIRGGNEVGASETTGTIINNESMLNSEATQFIHQHWSRDLGIWARLDATTIYVKNVNYPELQADIVEAFGYWEKWSGLRFIHTSNGNLRPMIFIKKSDGNWGVVGFQESKIWLKDDLYRWQKIARLVMICHEIGHAIGINGHPDDTSVMNNANASRIGRLRFFPYQQKAVKKVYSMPVGSKL